MNEIWFYAVLGIVILVGSLPAVISGLLRCKGSKSQSVDPLIQLPNMIVSKHFITSAEVNFYHVLNTVISDKQTIFCQVALNRLIYVTGNEKSNPGRKSWRNKIDRRSIDFVICDSQTLKPIVAIELDDKSHEKPSRQKRDREVGLIFEKAKLKLVRIPVQKAYSTQELGEVLGLSDSPAKNSPPALS